MKIAFFMLLLALTSCQSRKQSRNVNATDLVMHMPAHPKLHSHYSCNQVRLSNHFDIDIDYRCYSDSTPDNDSCLLQITIKNKRTKDILDTLAITLLHPYSTFYTSCDSMTSFTTGFHASRKLVDNWIGDIVVADFNFDNREDIAILNDDGGNAGPFYNFYIQTADKKFIPDPFLTDSVTYFPSTIDNRRKRLITLVNAGMCCVGKHVYNLDAKTGKWRQVSHKILGEHVNTN